jgi:integrase
MSWGTEPVPITPHPRSLHLLQGYRRPQSRRPHELRHSAVSLLSAAGVAEEEIADVVGHVTTRMTHQVYRHQVTPTIDAGKDAMEGLFGRKLDSNG